MRKKQRFALLLGAIAITTLMIILGIDKIGAEDINHNLPPLKVHPLPQSLNQWQTDLKIGDYFSQIEPTSVGYLIWSKFPIAVYIKPSINTLDNSASSLRSQKWVEAVQEAIAQWNIYLPLVVIEKPEMADIIIQREMSSTPVKINPETGRFDLPRARAGETKYQFYWVKDKPNVLYQQMTVAIRPGRGFDATLATTRHELGHALGIWGHSPLKKDALYFSQVTNPGPISARDINTLKKVYQQATRLN